MDLLQQLINGLSLGALYALLWLTTNPYRDRAKRPAAASGAPTGPTAPVAPAAIIETDAATSARTQEEPA